MSAAVLVLQLLAAAPAFDVRAPASLPALDQPAARDPNAPVWYGWEPLLADATAACFLGGALWTNTQQDLRAATAVLVLGGIGIYLFGGPGLHLARERPNVALLDLGLRVGLPLGGLMAGTVLALLTLQSGLVTVGFAVGIVSAIVADIAGLSWDPAEGTSPRTAASAPVRWAPFAGAVRGAPVAGLAARF